MNNKGFTLIEVLIVVAILGILVALAIPNLLDAIDRSKQRATVAELRLWGVALQEYNSAQSKLPAPTGPAPVTQALRDTLVPFTINTLPLRDKWGQPIYYENNLVDSYTIRSCGKDGVCGLGVTPSTWFNYNLDIVLNDGVFVNQPS